MVLVHSLMRWVVLLAAIAAVVGYGRARARGVFDPLAERLGALYAAAIGIQLLLGVVLWLIEGRWSGDDDVFLSFIHPVMMLIATGIASAGVARARRNSSATTGLVAVLTSLAVVILAVPRTAWPL